MSLTVRRLLGVGGALLLAGCSQQTINSARHDAQRDVTAAARQAHAAAQAARPQLQKAGLGARVTAALRAANVRGVRVDAGPGGVTLVGRVTGADDRARAVRIARDTLGPDKTVHSRITLSPP